MADIQPQQHAIAIVGKGGRPRTVFYGESVALLLRRYLKRRGASQPDDLLFVNSLDEPLLRFAMSERVHDYGQAAGIKGKRVSPHTLRHTFAVTWLMGGGDALSLQRLLGHTTPSMTSRYVNFASVDLAQLHSRVSPLDRLNDARTAPAGRRPAPAARAGVEPGPKTEPRKRLR
jgi:integrase/recombinase XerD